MEKPVESKTDPLQVVDLPNDAPDQPTTNDQFTHGARLVALTTSLMLGMFLVALDNVCPRGFCSILSIEKAESTLSRQSSAR
jgi:hypothetical protein